MKRSLAFLFCLCCWPVANAQRLRSQFLPNQSQLPVANIHRIFQDREGYMWYATEGGGLCRDDGYHVTVFRSDRNHPDLMASNDVTSIAEDGKGQIWFGTPKGCYILDKSDYSVRPVAGTEGKHVDNLLVRRNGDICMGIGSRLLIFSPQEQQKQSIPLTQDTRDTWVSSMTEDAGDGSLYATFGRSGLFRLDERRQAFVSAHWPYSCSASFVTSDSVNGGLWLGSWGEGAVRYLWGNYQLVENLQGEQQAEGFKGQVLNVVVDHVRQLLWVTTMEDVYAYTIRNGQFRPYPVASALPKGKKIIDSAILDFRGNLWVPGFSPHTFIISSGDGQISRDAVLPMSQKTGYRVMVDRIWHEDSTYYWIWQGRTGLSLYHQQTQRMVDCEELSPPDGHWFDKMLEPCRGQKGIWTRRDKQLFHVWHDGMQVRCEAVADLPHTIRCITDNGQRQWVGTSDEIVQITHGRTDGTIAMETIAKNVGNVTEILEFNGRNLLFISEKQGLLLREPTGRIRTLKDGVPFTSLTKMSDTDAWAATSTGNVYRIRAGKTYEVRLDTAACNVNGDAVKFVEADSGGHLWILSDQYLREYNPQNHASRVIRNTDKDIDMDYFHTIRVEGDSICLGGIGAFCYIPHSLRLDEDAVERQPRVTEISIDGHTTPVGTAAEIDIPADSRDVWLALSSFDFLHTKSIQLAFRFDNDDAWVTIDAGTNRFLLHDKRPGTYRLQVRVTDGFGRWLPGSEVAVIHIHGFWWASWWFLTLLFVIVTAICVWLIVHYLNALKRLRDRLMPHQLRLLLSPRTEIKRLKAKQMEKEAANRRFVEKVRTLIASHIDDSHYGVEQLSSDLGLTRQHLSKKLQETAGEKPTEVIRRVRLEKAASLLTDTDMSIAEIADITGFGTARYFSKCFKEHFNLLPREYRQRSKKE